MGDAKQVTFCKKCEKEVSDPLVKQMDTMEKSVWVILILATLGIGLIPFIFYYLFNKKKSYCPKCGSKLQTLTKKAEEPKESAEPATPRARVLEKALQAKQSDKKLKEEIEVKTIYCQYCGEKIEEGLDRCPYCKSVMK